jgi:hypothetical protein
MAVEEQVACGRCWLEQRPMWDVPIKWTYTKAEHETLACRAKDLPRATHQYRPPCKCGSGCGDEMICAAHAERVAQPQHVQLLDTEARRTPAPEAGAGEEGGR